MNKVFKLALYGDSLACPRKGIVKSHERYIALIENHIRRISNYDYLETRDKAIGGATITRLIAEFKEDNTYFDLPGNILIIHSGIVDCAPRPINEVNRKRISRLPGFLKTKIIKYIHHNRANLLNRNGGYVKTDFSKFSSQFSSFVNEAILYYEKIFVINICSTTERIEAHSPGFINNINRYNTEIRTVISKANSNKVYLVDINHYINSHAMEIENFIVAEDGHHIHPITHRWIADQIISQI